MKRALLFAILLAVSLLTAQLVFRGPEGIRLVSRYAMKMALFIAILLAASLLSAQTVSRGPDVFPADEYAARRARVMEQIGDGVAIILRTTEPPGEVAFRQNEQFFY